MAGDVCTITDCGFQKSDAQRRCQEDLKRRRGGKVKTTEGIYGLISDGSFLTYLQCVSKFPLFPGQAARAHQAERKERPPYPSERLLREYLSIASTGFRPQLSAGSTPFETIWDKGGMIKVRDCCECDTAFYSALEMMANQCCWLAAGGLDEQRRSGFMRLKLSRCRVLSPSGVLQGYI